MIFAGQENPFIIFRSEEIWVFPVIRGLLDFGVPSYIGHIKRQFSWDQQKTVVNLINQNKVSLECN